MTSNNDISLANWFSGENTRWAYQHLDQLIATRVVKRGGPISEFQSNAQDILTLHYWAADKAEHTVSQMLAESFTDGFCVIHKGKIVAEHYFADMTENSKHLSQSVSKSIVSTVMGVLIDQGEVNLKKMVDYYVPELKASGYEGATISDVLDMRSGIIFDETYTSTDPNSLEQQFDRAMGWVPPINDNHPKTINSFLLSLKKGRSHGGFFQYRSVETEVLGWVLSRVSKLNLADLLSEVLWQPLGAQQDAYFTVDSENTCVADGGFNATLRDYARFGQLFSQNGFYNGKQIVSESWVAACRKGDIDAYNVRYKTDDLPYSCYSKQWWVNDSSRGVHCAYGVGGQMIYINHQTDTVIVKLSSWPDYRNDAMHDDAWRACEAISSQLSK